MAAVADRVVVRFRPAEGDPERVRVALEAAEYRAYLRRVHGGPVSVGDEWAEFVSEGCSAPRDVTLRVESVEGGSELGAETDLRFVGSSPADSG